MKKLNIVLFNDNFEPCVDGVIKTVVNYANILSKHHNVIVICPKYYNQSNDYQFKVYRVASLRHRKYSYAIAMKIPHFRLNRILNKFKPDIFHVHSPFLIGHYALRYAKRKKVPLVSTFHSKYKDDFLEFSKSQFLTKIAMKYIMNFYHKCNSIWTCSNDTKNTLNEYGYNGNITIMQNGTDFIYPVNLSELKSKVSRMFNIDSNKHNILFVGQLIWQKNIKLILDTAKILLEDDPNYHFYFVGTSLFEKQIKEYSMSLNIYKNTTFTGVIKDRDLLKGMYASCDLFFFPSLYDNAPLVIREAAVLNLASLVSLNSTCSEVITDSFNGYIEISDKENMANKIKKIFSDKELLKNCGLNASKTIPKKWSDIMVEVVKEYELIIKEYHEKKK